MLPVFNKVWQELPDAPPTDAEKLVANKFRNEIGDDLQNAMGLSVTTRLLNVHNPLYVKLYFSGKPEAGCLQSFIREHKITAFKRIADSSRDMFAARFDHLADFDRFCVHKEVKCGSATVAITPCYKYLSCPTSVKTVYADNIANAEQATKPTTNSSPQKQADSDKKENAESAAVKTNKAVEQKVNTEIGKSETGVNTTSNKTATTVLDSKAAILVTAKAAQKPTSEITETAQEAPTEPKKVTPKKVENQTEPEKITPKKVENATEAKKVTPKKVEIATEAKKATPKIVENATEAKKETPKKVENATEAKKATPKKVESNNEAKKNVDDKIKDIELKADVIDEMMVVDEMAEEDDEEMTDQDILALMSGGIVLDECSGSDEEK